MFLFLFFFFFTGCSQLEGALCLIKTAQQDTFHLIVHDCGSSIAGDCSVNNRNTLIDLNEFFPFDGTTFASFLTVCRSVLSLFPPLSRYS